MFRYSLVCDGDFGFCGFFGVYGLFFIVKDVRIGVLNFFEGEGLVSVLRWFRKGIGGKGWEEECFGVLFRFCSYRGFWG